MTVTPDMLLAAAASPAELPACCGVGIYAIYLADPDGLPPITAGRGGLLYVGMTEQGLDARNHFVHAHSGFSTFRRSLGAVLKDRLELTAIPRSAGASKSNVRNYRFTNEGETALTRWMNGNLRVAQMALTTDVASQENELISLMEPPLNLTGWPNPQRPFLKRLRAHCAEEAARNRIHA